MSAHKTGIAIIGAGYWGKNLVRNFHSLGVLRVICDSDPSAHDSMRKSYPGVTIVADVAQAIANPEVDAVAIATPAGTHYSLASECIAAGKDVYVEKPLCLDVADGEKLVQQAAKAGKILMVGHLLQYHPAIIKLKELVKTGELGRLQYIYSNRLNLGKIRMEEDILWSFAPHDISVILSLTNQMPDSVASFGSYFLHKNIADVTMSNLTFHSGISAHIFVNWLHPFKEQKLVIVGDKKMAVFNDIEPEDKLLLYPHTINWRSGVPVPDKKEAVKIELEKTEPLLNECKSFVDAVQSRVPPFTDGQEGLNVLKTLTACQLSMKRGGKIVRLDEPVAAVVDYFAHPTAIVDEGCLIGNKTKIWSFSHVLKGSVVGESCNIGQNVVIGPNVKIGNGCKIQNNVSVYDGVTLEEDVFCGPSMVFTNVLNPRAHIVRKSEYKPTLVKKGTTIGANATIVCGVTLGEYSFIGAGAVVTKDAPPYALMVGAPALRKAWMCSCGVKLDFKKNRSVCKACGETYALKNGSVAKAPAPTAPKKKK